MTQPHRHRCAGMLAILALASLAAWSGGEEPVVFAEFIPADSSTWPGWRASIYDDGYTEQSVRDGAGWSKRRVPRLAPADLQSLLRIVEVTDFQGMESLDRIPDTAEPRNRDTLRLTVRTLEGPKTVTVQLTEYAVSLAESLETHPRRDRLRDFLRVWRKTIALVRPPNPEQTRRLYRD